ncbi:MAG: hypothetical protein JWN98_2440 [Abditibacteriota bacterium]|nr:hypothetical protein [Abditibacteriota bacterium]
MWPGFLHHTCHRAVPVASVQRLPPPLSSVTYHGLMDHQNDQAPRQHFDLLGKLADKVMLDKVRSGQPSGRIPLGYTQSLAKDGIKIDIL